MTTLSVLPTGGRPFVRWRPVPPLNQRWLAAIDKTTDTARRRWLERRRILEQDGRYDETIAALVDSWNDRGFLPRPIGTHDRSGTEILLEMAFDGAIAVSLGLETPPEERFPRETARAQAAELLFTPIREQRDLKAEDVLRLHRLICTAQDATTAMTPGGALIEGNSASRGHHRGRLREVPIYVDGTDNLLKEGCPPEMLDEQLRGFIRTISDARRAGTLGPVRGAWMLFGLGVVHPFLDGNGRTARMLSSFVLIRDGGFPLLIPPALYRTYLDAFAAARRDHPEPLIRLVAECQRMVLDSAISFNA